MEWTSNQAGGTHRLVGDRFELVVEAIALGWDWTAVVDVGPARIEVWGYCSADEHQIDQARAEAVDGLRGELEDMEGTACVLRQIDALR
jgi:hypothetical protein